MKINILTKLLVSILTTAILVYSSSIIYISIKTRKMALDDAKRLAKTYSKQYANQAAADLNIDMGITRALANIALSYKNLNDTSDIALTDSVMKHIFVQNPEYLSIWLSRELSAFMPNYTKNHGRFVTEVFLKDKKIAIRHFYRDLDSDNPGSLYYIQKTKKQESLVSPYFYSLKMREPLLIELHLLVLERVFQIVHLKRF